MRKLPWIVLLSSLAISTTAYAQEIEERQLLPNDRDYEAQESGQECSVIRAVLRHAESDFNDVAQQRQNYKQVVLQRRQDLETCARRASLSLSRDPRAMALVAEYCPAEYDAWLYTGAHYRMLRDDDQEAQRSIRTLVTHASRHCSPLPEQPQELPAPENALNYQGGELAPPPTL